MRTRLEKIKFIIWFVIIYSVLLLIGLKLFGNALIKLDTLIIKQVLGNIINYNSFIFVPECSGIVAISAYLAIVLGLIIIKYKIDWKWIISSVVLLGIWNVIRIIIVVYSEKISFTLAQVLHVTLWFITGIIIVLLAIKSLKKK
jgi:exosortase/archaeosortase family protein